jgi:hypothetical protein
MPLNQIWKLLYPHWKKPAVELIPGYTIMILVPGDLPFFLKIALETCAKQDPEGLVETLVVPDNRLQTGFVERMEEWAENYSISPVRLVSQNPLERLLTRHYAHYHNNYWLQVVRGINAVRTTHVLFHDVDLFIEEPDFLRRHYEACVAENLAVRGVSKAWDPWFAEQGIHHVVATWESIFDINWFRSFRPWQHRGQDEMIAGKRHSCDATYWAQCQTPPEKIGCESREVGFIHFNYVTGNYRRFQTTKGPFEDIYFRLLLLRLLIDAYDPSGWKYDIPSMEVFVRGTSDSSNRVTYLEDSTRQGYSDFRSLLQVLLDSPLLRPQQASIIRENIRPFDQIFGFSQSRSLTGTTQG